MISSRSLILVLAGLGLLLPASAQSANTDGAVFAMTNAAAGNEIVAFVRDSHGGLTLGSSVATNGLGTGQELGSQNSLVLSDDRSFLFAVNAGSDEISVFSVQPTGLVLADKVASGGSKPVSLALHRDVLYVLNAGNPNSVTGFTVSTQGKLSPILNSMQPLSAAVTNPGQIGWNPRGDVLIVTEKDTNMLDRFTFDNSSNTLAHVDVVPSIGHTPFGFAFRGTHRLLVAEAETGLANKGSVTEYALRHGKTFTTVPSQSTTETSTCWLVTATDSHFAYVSNTGSNSITGFRVTSNSLTLLDPTGVSAMTGSKPADLALVRDGFFLYALNSGDGTISGWLVSPTDGSLTSLGPATSGLPMTGAAGLAAH